MHAPGTLVKWNEKRGFGFIALEKDGEEVFVHISAFPKEGSLPRLGELLWFEIELNDDGKQRAVDVRRPAGSNPSRTKLEKNSDLLNRRNYLGYLAAMVILVALGAYGYTCYSSRPLASALDFIESTAKNEDQSSIPPQILDTHCDGRTHCSQMTSCAEARFYLNNCPGTEMDGDHDGIPCEGQWCRSLLAK